MTQTILVTGASSGIGRAAALELASAGHRLIAVGRSEKKLGILARDLDVASPSAGTGHRTMSADFSSLTSVRELASRVLESEAILDVLAANAGNQPQRRVITEDGFESTFQVNHLAHFVLSELLAPLLRASAGRIVVTASSSHTEGTLDLDDVNMEKAWSPAAAYGRSKLANILFSQQVMKRLGVPSSSFHPGDILTDINREAPFVRFTKPFERFRYRPAREGATTLVWLATSDEGAAPTAAYYVDCRPAACSAAAQDVTLAELLWDASADLVASAPWSGRDQP